MTREESLILVIDDDESIRISLSAFFEDRGWSVLSCESAETALNQLRARPASAAIVDTRMGGMTGDDFIKAATNLNPNIVFLICTGSLDYELPQSFVNVPRICGKVFRKPLLNISELEAALKTLLETVHCEDRL